MLALVRAHRELKQARDWLKDQNAFLESEIARRMADHLEIQDISIRTLAGLAEVRDSETGNPLLRTRAYVRTLALRLRTHPRFAALLTPAYIETLAKSTPLHDIGKVGVPDHMLLKPGKLSTEEFSVMKTHAKLGSDAIENAERDAELDHPQVWRHRTRTGDLRTEGMSMLAKLERLIGEISELNSPLILLVGANRDGKTQLLRELGKKINSKPLNVGLELGRRLAATPRIKRGFLAGEWLREIADRASTDDLLLLDNLELLFEPSLRINPLDLVRRLAHARRVVAVWPGERRGDRLVYADMSHPEHRDDSRDGAVVLEI